MVTAVLKLAAFLALVSVAICAVVTEDRVGVKLDVLFDEFRPHLFRIVVDGKSWFQSSDIFFRSENKTFSTTDGTAVLLSRKESIGSDKQGQYNRFDLTFSTSASSAPAMIASIKAYSEYIIFEQSFPNGLFGTSTGDADGLVTAFPSFSTEKAAEEPTRGYAHWISWFYDANPTLSSERRKLLVAPGFATPVYGRWDSTATLPPGGIGGTGVTAVYDSSARYCSVMGGFLHPMALSSVSRDGTVLHGVMGNTTHLPTDFRPQFLLSFSSQGVNHALLSFGQIFLVKHRKVPGWRQRDITLRWLGFTTDNGAYYYYHTLPNASYDATLRAVHAYARKEAIPYRYMLLDSWWYLKGSNGGVSSWTAQPTVFPNGIAALTNATGMYIQAHNRYWAYDNVYKDRYAFVLDPSQAGAVPVDHTFWTDLLRDGATNWKLAVYEQDWLWNEFGQYVAQMLEDVHLGRLWLSQMNAGAMAHNLAIQYCMPFVRHLLPSPEMQAVTQARASDDYVVSPYDGVDNWRIGGQSLLIAALGMLPSKDGFWSSTHQPGNPYGEDRYEPYPRLQSAVTSLSGGPVAIADGISFTDRALVMRACDQDGRLLFPSKPATSVDLIYAQQLRADAHELLSQEVWAAHTFVPLFGAASHTSSPLAEFFAPPVGEASSMVAFAYIFAADIVQTDLQLTPSMVGLRGVGEWVVREANDSAALQLQTWAPNHPLRVLACGEWDFQLYTVSPQLSGGWVLLGEPDKWVAVSEQRFAGIFVQAQGPEFLLRGSAHEPVTILLRDSAGAVRTLTCSFPAHTSALAVPDSWLAMAGRERGLEMAYPDLPTAVYMLMRTDGTCV